MDKKSASAKGYYFLGGIVSSIAALCWILYLSRLYLGLPIGENLASIVIICTISGPVFLFKGFRAKKEKGYWSSSQTLPSPAQPRCAGCGAIAPRTIFQPGRVLAGYFEFGRCTSCGKVWCSNCDLKKEKGDNIYHKCPSCSLTLSNDLFS
jgi:hypothetical protein